MISNIWFVGSTGYVAIRMTYLTTGCAPFYNQKYPDHMQIPIKLAANLQKASLIYMKDGISQDKKFLTIAVSLNHFEPGLQSLKKAFQFLLLSHIRKLIENMLV